MGLFKKESWFEQIHNELKNIGFSTLGNYETEVLYPHAVKRVEYFNELLSELLKVCDDKNMATDIKPALKKIMPADYVEKAGDQISERFLNDLKKMIQESMLEDIKQFCEKHSKKEEDLKNITTFIKFLNDVRYLSSQIVQNKNSLFHLSFRNFPIIRHVQSGEDLVGLPMEIDIVLLPFKVVLEQLYQSASTLEKSIEVWEEKRIKDSDRAAKYAVAKKENSTHKLILGIQFFAIVLTVALSFLFVKVSDPLNIYTQNDRLKKKIETLIEEDQSQRSTIDVLKKELIEEKEKATAVEDKLKNFNQKKK